MTKKSSITTRSEANWNALIDELEFLNSRMDLIEKSLIQLKDASNAYMITLASVMKILLSKGIITEEELESTSQKMTDDLKEQTKKAAEKLKKEDKESRYDKILNSDINANA